MTTNPRLHHTISIYHIQIKSKQMKGSTKTWLNETNVNEFTDEKKGTGREYLVGWNGEEFHGPNHHI